MNKKFLSAILFGALMVTSTGTFVSCKDYDDDIENLQEQINKLATKEDMTSQIASLQSALTAAQGEAAAAKATAAEALDKANSIAATATDAEKAAAEAEKAAAKAALDAAAAKEEAIKAAQEEVAKAQKALQEAIAADFEAVKKDLAAQIAKLTEKVEEMTGYTTEMLTSLQIKINPTLDLNYARIDINYPKGLVKGGEPQTPDTYVFGEGMPGAFTLTDNEVNTVKDNMVIAVNPVNAVVTSDMLSLVNGKGGTVDNYVDFTVANYKGNTIITRAAETGLRKIGVQLKKDVDFEAFDKLVLSGKNHNVLPNEDCSSRHQYIAYALSVTDAQDRTVMTGYEISMHVIAEQPATGIAENSYLASSAQKMYEEPICYYQWGYDGTGYESAFPITSGEAFELSVGSDLKKGGRLMASYVVVDYDNEELSTTDKAAIKGLTVDGVNKVSKDLYHAISVSGTYATGVSVPLKLVTVDYRGNIDVNVFWVKAGEPVSMSATYTVTPSKNVSYPYAWAPTAKTGESTMEEFKVPANAEFYSIEWYVGETNHQNNKEVAWTYEGNMKDINNGDALRFYDANKELTADPEYIAYSEFVGTLNLQLMREDKAYAGIIKFYDKNNTHIGTNEIAVKKVLPTTIPAGLTAKTNAIQSDGTLKVYPKAINGVGVYDLANAFNFTDKLKADEYLNFVEANEFKYDDIVWAVYDNATRTIKDINGETIGKDTKYPTTVTYNYGDILYHAEGHGVADPDNYEVTWATKFDVVFACYPVESTYAWYTAPTVYYNEEITIFGKDKDGNDKYNFLTVKNPYGMKTDAFDSENAAYWTDFAYYLNSEKCQKVELWTNGDKTKVNEFFIPTYVADSSKPATGLNLKPNPNSVNTVLSGDVETTVVIYVVDKFGHEHAIEALKFTMKKEHPAE